MEARRPPSRLAKGKPPLETSASPENLAFRPLRELCSSNLPFCRFTVPRTTRVIRRVIRRIVDLQLNNCDKRAGERERERELVTRVLQGGGEAIDAENFEWRGTRDFERTMENRRGFSERLNPRLVCSTASPGT